MDRGAWQTTTAVYGVVRVGHDWATKHRHMQQGHTVLTLNILIQDQVDIMNMMKFDIVPETLHVSPNLIVLWILVYEWVVISVHLVKPIKPMLFFPC